MRLLPLIVLLAGCQMPGTPGVTVPVQFQLTDEFGSKTYDAGQTIALAPVFDVDVGLVGPDMAGVRLDRLYVTSYTPECDDQPVPELYRTKVIVYPEAVTDAPASPQRLGYHFPLSTRTLMNLGLCNAQRPQSGLFRLHADLTGAPPADLMIRIGDAQPASR